MGVPIENRRDRPSTERLSRFAMGTAILDPDGDPPGLASDGPLWAYPNRTGSCER